MNTDITYLPGYIETGTSNVTRNLNSIGTLRITGRSQSTHANGRDVSNKSKWQAEVVSP